MGGGARGSGNGTTEDRLVFSTGRGRIRPKKSTSSPEPGDGFVRVRREVKGRGGKTMTTIHGIPLDAEGLRALASELKRRCGTGGSAKKGVIEIQGDHRDVLVTELEARGYRVKRAGG